MRYDVIVIGGGLVGLASAMQLLSTRSQLKVLLLEKESRVAMHQSGRNSGVIHSGIYYPPKSIKAENCLHGYKELIQFSTHHGIPFEICGKVIVATKQSELKYMHQLFERGMQHGLEGIRKISREELREHEPHVDGLAGLLVPQTGIVDFTLVAQKYSEQILQKGGKISFNQQVIKIQLQQNECTVITQDSSFTSKLVINCAGLYSDVVARMTGQALSLRIIPFRGEYYALKKHKNYLVKNLIYPVPNPDFPFLGVHFTRTIREHTEAGPNAVFAPKREGYIKGEIHFSELIHSLSWPGFQKIAIKYWKTGLAELYRSYSKTAFTRALQNLVPEIQKDDLIRAGVGVRAQACSWDGRLIDDFVILENKYAINVCNAPSPAATASLAIGKTIARLAEKRNL